MGRGSALGSLASATCQSCSCDPRMFAILQPASFNMLLRHKQRCASAAHGGHRRDHQSKAFPHRLGRAPRVKPQHLAGYTSSTDIGSAWHVATVAAQTAAETTASYRGQNAGRSSVKRQPRLLALPYPCTLCQAMAARARLLCILGGGHAAASLSWLRAPDRVCTVTGTCMQHVVLRRTDQRCCALLLDPGLIRGHLLCAAIAAAAAPPPLMTVPWLGVAVLCRRCLRPLNSPFLSPFVVPVFRYS